jgi:hypothetical protein|tara:strand:+ start:213 stop:395 length:183 start_codon:yes stop_codon:yes gene_type:complete
MTEEKMIEEILYESHSVGMRSEVMERAHDIMGSEDFQKDYRNRRIDAYQQAYNELVESKL